ncbi:XRE family transcriptional regulator [Streptomyces sp. NPDC056500]|uniref:XRE family transcriptional regulator n=1 Tax=Streptomyces sp. NPDC056500 TaxID=3345840 RepID=UPI0036CFB970
MYDRRVLRAVARDKGIHTPTDLQHALMVAPATAWRLWNGHTAPAARTSAAVQRMLGLTADDLLRRTPDAA